MQEPDHSSYHFYPVCEKWSRFLRLIEDAVALRGDISLGQHIFRLLRQTELQDVQVRAAVLALQDRHPYMGVALIGARAMRERMIAAGLTTEAEFEELVQAVQECLDDPERMQITFTTVQVWGRKPPA